MKNVQNLMWMIGMVPSGRGYDYLVTSIDKVMEDRTYLNDITKKLYPYVASLYDTSEKGVEIAIRRIIRQYWEEEGMVRVELVTGYRVNYRPTTKEFIRIMAQHLINERNNQGQPLRRKTIVKRH